MGKKYVTVKDIEKEIDSIKNYIEFWNIDLNQETERLENLNVLLDYLYKGGFCPLTKNQLSHNRELNYYILPLKTRINVIEREKFCKKPPLKFSFSNLENILEDFIDFVCECKGHKIGVGHHLIEKYLCLREFE